MEIIAMICIQLEKGTREEQIRESLGFDNELDIDIKVYIGFAIENNLIVQDEESRRYKITNYGREFINEFLPDVQPL
jgi:hypothetical protein